MHAYDNFSAHEHEQLLSFVYLIMIDVQVMVIVGVIPRSCHIFMQLEKYGGVVHTLNNMKANIITSEHSEFVVQ